MVSLTDLRRLLSWGPTRHPRPPIEPPPDPWPDTRRGARVLVEHPDPVWRWAARQRLESAGYEVATCGGPSVLPRGRCPLIAGEPCRALEGAEVVINGLGTRYAASRAVLEAVRAARPELPVIVELTQLQIRELDDVLPGCRVVRYPVGPVELVREVEVALRP